MHRLIAEVGVPILVLSAFLLGMASTTLIGWVIEDRDPERHREGWPYW